MKQMIRRLSLWSACLLALGSTPTWAQQAQAGGSVYIQGSEVNLRDKASTTAKVVGKVTIATECQHVKDAPKQWVRIKCGEVEGFTLKSLVGAQKPTAEALLAQAQDTPQPATARLDAAMRAATLDSKNEQALKLLADLFFDVNFEQLLKDRKKGGLHEAFIVKRRELEDPKRKETGEEGLLRELEKIEYDWHRFQLRRNDFVSAMYRDGALVVYTGDYESLDGMFKLEEDQSEFRVTIESRSSSAVSDVLKLALGQGARPPRADTEKYTSFYAEYPGMAILRPEAFRLLRALPPRWHLLSEEVGAHFIRSTCGWAQTRELRFDLHRRAIMESGDGDLVRPGSFEQSGVSRITDISRSGSTYTFRIRPISGEEYTRALSWPTGTPGVGIWNDSGPGSEGSPYAAGAARGIDIREHCSAQ
ncbi:hypothetical protein HPC49_12515 [Pyxidicoccus fallax]|uniref:SH3b domain-containing protein n=1 Tax=Pyxidicoccus fallax TaxID=394095 RepID=A0A848LP18_9BACT|nr:hypothetical protein [Pyxidicoccus fallax]NMO19617.1 hypothetical protein [Pyxidicoccus fallax]NPC79058.1 hypothetical protein [Pyxidicoccus fallax]